MGISRNALFSQFEFTGSQTNFRVNFKKYSKVRWNDFKNC